jgi:hypothetical protein
MLDRDMHRRRFLQTSGLAAAGMAAVQVGAILIDPRPVQAMAMAALNDHRAQTLLAMARQLFPHDERSDPLPEGVPVIEIVLSGAVFQLTH